MMVCRNCGEKEDSHCVAVWLDVPDGCKCVASTWGDIIPPICDAHKGADAENCGTCEHDFDCHAKRP